VTFDAFAGGETVPVGPGGQPSAPLGHDSPVGGAVGRQFHEYRIVEELGRGGMGVVYRAIQETLDRPVALKIIRTGEAAREEDIRQFLREASAAARLRHPNIVTVYELDVHEGTYYYTMEYIAGRNLGTLIGERGMDAREAVRIAAKVARALEHAHRRDIVHRDLKPGNIIVQADGEPVVTDFGLACDLRQPGASQALAAGTPDYMAPEQVLGRRDGAGPPCDIWALGALLYEMLTGRTPFGGDSVRELFEAIATQAPRPPGQLRPGIDPRLSGLVMKCLEKDPQNRWGSAGELAEALEAWLGSPGRPGPA
jgi:serine/threonine protein kinase